MITRFYHLNRKQNGNMFPIYNQEGSLREGVVAG